MIPPDGRSKGAPAPTDEVLYARVLELVRSGLDTREKVAVRLDTSTWAIRNYVVRAKAEIAGTRFSADPAGVVVDGDPLDALGGYEAAVARAVDVTFETTEELHEWLGKRGFSAPPDWDALTITDHADLPAGEEGSDDYTPAWWRIRNPEKEGEQLVLREPDPVKSRVFIAAKLPERRAPEGLKCAVFFPDTQINYWQDRNEQWHTTMDEAAVDVAMQILADVEAEHGVDEFVQLGDYLDLPHYSKHRSSPAQMSIHGLNRSFARGAKLLSDISALTPRARRHLLQGNHDARVILHLIDTNPLFVGLAPEGDTSGEPLISLERLLGVARNGFKLSNPYPHERVYLRPDWKAVHGDCVAQTVKQTNDRYMSRAEEHTTYGHTHRRGVTWKTIEKGHGFVRISASSSGTLCRVDGAVPSAKGGHTSWGEPSLARGENWEQGIQVSLYEPHEGGLLSHEVIAIEDGKAIWRGRSYVARCDVDGNPL